MVDESTEITNSMAPVPAVEMAVQPSPVIGPKILLYSHDTFGLGNIHRTLLVAEALTGALPGAAVLPGPVDGAAALDLALAAVAQGGVAVEPGRATAHLTAR